ncbi:MAG: glycosyltransferase family 4 protein [Chloroflexi bacterium]|nr:glycosyltransferase family 4 protein [Chloroflexota bacterium]
MKIAFITHSVHVHGGVPNYVFSLAKSMAADHEISLFCVNVEGLRNADIHHRKVWGFNGDGLVHSLTFSLTSALLIFLSRFRESGGFDIIHTHGNYTGLEDVMTSHFCEAAELERLRTQKLRVPLFQKLQRLGTTFLEKQMVRGAQGRALIVPSGRMKLDMIRQHDSKADSIFVVHSGVDSERYDPRHISLYRTDVRQRHSIGKDASVVLFVGGDWERKGLACAIIALSLMDCPKTVLLVIGQGDIDAYGQIARERGVEGRVIFAGLKKEVWKYYAAGDVVVLPTLNEAFGLVVLEAMSMGLPVLVSSLAGASELIEDGLNGLLIKDPSDASEIATKLDAILSNERLRRLLAEEGRQTALKYTWDMVARKHVEVYKWVLSSRSTKWSPPGPNRQVGR